MLPLEQYLFGRAFSTMLITCILRRLQESRWALEVTFFLCFIDLKKVYKSVDSTLLCRSPPAFGYHCTL